MNGPNSVAIKSNRIVVPAETRQAVHSHLIIEKHNNFRPYHKYKRMQAIDLVLTERRQFSAESNLSPTKSNNQVLKGLDSIMSEAAPLSPDLPDSKFSFKLTQIPEQLKE